MSSEQSKLSEFVNQQIHLFQNQSKTAYVLSINAGPFNIFDSKRLMNKKTSSTWPQATHARLQQHS
jgi:hypothetical protein